jgi:hypothetical protein
VSDTDHQHDERLVLDLVHNAVVAHADPIQVGLPLERLHPGAARIAGEGIDPRRAV